MWVFHTPGKVSRSVMAVRLGRWWRIQSAMSLNTADQETEKRPIVPRQDISTLQTRQYSAWRWRPVDEEETQILASISGITPLPVKTTDLMIDADWFRAFHTWLDAKSHGKANSIISLLSFLVIGGSASIINLMVVLIFDIVDKTHRNDLAVQLLYGAIATEISLIYNFMLNDRFTFKLLVDKNRTWLQRCIRFHGPAMVGFVLTQVLHAVFYLALRGTATPHITVVSQALAILIVTFVNFAMHRFWTYRPQKPRPATA